VENSCGLTRLYKSGGDEKCIIKLYIVRRVDCISLFVATVLLTIDILPHTLHANCFTLLVCGH
jgi:hypothetical protein